jgi:putative endonuclease
MSSPHHDTGKKGETIACRWLAQHDYNVQHCNWRYAHFEVDMVAVKDGVLHFIEVKTRRSLQFGQPEESISKKKMLALMNAAREYQRQYPGFKRIQFDVLSITLRHNEEPEIFFIEDVYL